MTGRSIKTINTRGRWARFNSFLINGHGSGKMLAALMISLALAIYSELFVNVDK